MVNKAGNEIRKHRSKITDLFGRNLTVRNFTSGVADDWGDSEKTLDTEVVIEGVIEQPSEPAEVSTAQGQTTTIDAEIWLPDETVVTDGSDVRPYPSEIIDIDGTTYTVVEVFTDGTGFYRVDAVSTGNEM